MDVAPRRKSAKIPPIAQASPTSTEATKDHPATLSRPPRVTAIVKLAQNQWRFDPPEGRKRVHERRERADAVDEEGRVQVERRRQARLEALVGIRHDEPGRQDREDVEHGRQHPRPARSATSPVTRGRSGLVLAIDLEVRDLVDDVGGGVHRGRAERPDRDREHDGPRHAPRRVRVVRRAKGADRARDDADERRQQRERARETDVALHGSPRRRARRPPANVFNAFENSWSRRTSEAQRHAIRDALGQGSEKAPEDRRPEQRAWEQAELPAGEPDQRRASEAGGRALPGYGARGSGGQRPERRAAKRRAARTGCRPPCPACRRARPRRPRRRRATERPAGERRRERGSWRRRWRRPGARNPTGRAPRRPCADSRASWQGSRRGRTPRAARRRAQPPRPRIRKPATAPARAPDRLTMRRPPSGARRRG